MSDNQTSSHTEYHELHNNASSSSSSSARSFHMIAPGPGPELFGSFSDEDSVIDEALTSGAVGVRGVDDGPSHLQHSNVHRTKGTARKCILITLVLLGIGIVVLAAVVLVGVLHASTPPAAIVPCITEEWTAAVAAGTMLVYEGDYTASIRTQPNIGNGYVGTIITSDTVFIGGVYNGHSYTTPSHRARIPSPLLTSVKDADVCATALDLTNGLYIRRWHVPGHAVKRASDIIVQQQFYAHRLHQNALVQTFSAYGDSGEVVIELNHTKATPSADIDFASLPSGQPCELQVGVITTPEVDGGSHVKVATCTSTVPSKLSLQVAMWPSSKSPVLPSISFLSVMGTSFEDENPADFVQSKFKSINAEQPQTLLQQHTDAWALIWDSLPVVEGPDSTRLSTLLMSSYYYLLSSLRADWAMYASISPGGTAVNSYNGHVFWDCETWMLPAVLPFFPTIVNGMIQYRIDRIPAAEKRASDLSFDGTMFPWESAYTGIDCTPTGNPEGRYEQHINGDIAMAVRSYYYATGDSTWMSNHAWALVSGVADFWASRVRPVHTNGTFYYAIDQVQPPDESAEVVNNSVYTNAVAVSSLRFAIEIAQSLNLSTPSNISVWKHIADHIIIPFDEARQLHPEYDGFLEHPHMINQADVALLQYPLNWPLSESVRLSDLEYYENITRPNGYFTGDAVYTIAFLRLGNTARASKSFAPTFDHIRGPFHVWQEKLVGGHYNFLTATGGFLQTMINGCAGLEYADQALLLSPPAYPCLGLTRIRMPRVMYLGATIQVDVSSGVASFNLVQSGITPLFARSTAVSSSTNDCGRISDAATTLTGTAWSISTVACT
jgi:protein-glucosylgalactosylhydroxylysine glucosidase